MSLRMSRRAAAGSGGASGVVSAVAVAASASSAPVAEIRSRKWTKQLKTVGHLTILKWVPDQEIPTQALQKGVSKKTKGGRKRQVASEIGRMTRSVRQHLDAPLELLSEFPMLRSNAAKQPASAPVSSAAAPTSGGLASTPAAMASPALDSAPAAAAAAAAVDSARVGDSVKGDAAAPAASSEPANPQARLRAPLVDGSAGDLLLPSTVPSNEQLEMALDDLPMLDSDEELPFDSLVDDHVLSGAGPAAPSSSEQLGAGASTPADESVENTAESTAGDDDDDDAASSPSSSDDGDDNGSADSASPQSSPMLSRSPSP